MRRGDICWADLGDPIGSEPGFRRPVLIVQDDAFNASRLATVIVLSLTSNLAWRTFPGCVLLRAHETGLERDSVVNATQMRSLDRARVEPAVGSLDGEAMHAVDNALRRVLGV